MPSETIRLRRNITRSVMTTLYKSQAQSVITPRYGLVVAVWHDAMKLRYRGVEHKRQEIAVSLPERQLQQPVDRYPGQRPLGVLRAGSPMPAVDDKDKAEPIFAVPAKSWPV